MSDKVVVSNPTDLPVIDLQKFTIFPPSRNAPIVYQFNLQVRRGTLVALMGGSGCGKTTLMVYLTRRMKNPYSDWGVTADAHIHPKRVEFVAQKEMFFPFDTPERHLLVLRQRRFLESFSDSVAAVERTLRLVGLDDESKWRAQIGEGGRDSTLSGGERRLLTVAAALIMEPEMVILDEPTSGMDGYTALNICHQLHVISRSAGTTFVVSIHQPSDKVLSEFDVVERMTPPSGIFERRPLTTEAAEAKLDNQLAKVVHHSGDDAAAHDNRNLPTEVDTVSLFPRFAHLFRLYVFRSFLRAWTNWRAGPLRLCVSLAFAIMCGVAWVNLDFADGSFIRDILGMALAIIGLSFAPIILNATLFATERDMLLEEHVHLDHAALFADIASRFLADLVLGAGAAVVLLVAVPIIGIKYVGWFYLTMWLQAWAADSFGLWISMVAPPHISIGVVTPTVGFLSIALGTGLMQPTIENEGYIFHVCKWASFFKYGFQAILLKELPRATIPCTKTCFVSTGVDMLDMMHLTGDGYETTMGFQYLMLFAFTIIFRVMSFVTLRALILVGNRRYSYDNSSAGAAAPALPPPTNHVPMAPDGQPLTSEVVLQQQVIPQDTDEALPQSPAEAPLTTQANTAAWDRSSGGSRVWTMHPVRTASSFLTPMIDRIFGTKSCELENRVVLDVPSFMLNPRETVAIIGPTGCGKTLLLRHLALRLGDGVIADAPTKFYSTCEVCREATIQFVDGNDEILPNLQAIEPVAFHKMLYDDSGITAREVDDAAAEQLLALGIHAEKHKNMAYTLSGGQLRRLSVACKTVMQPAVLLIDEPTSGLDHDAAVNLGRHLQSMARNSGVAIVCSLQQPDPELLKSFDTFVFMREGRIVVRGTEAECRKHLRIPTETPSWAEEALHSLARSCEGETCTRDTARIPEQSQESHPVLTEDQRIAVFHAPRRSTLFCIKTLTRRSWLNRWARAPSQTLGAFIIRYLLLPVILSVLLVNIGNKDPYYFSRSGLIFVFCACLTFSSMLNGAVNFPVQRRMVEEEINANLYTTTAYLLSQWFTTALLEDAIGCVLASIALKYIASLEANLGIIIAVAFVTSQTCDSIGYLCGLFRNLPVASGLTVLILMPFMIGGNVIATTEQVTRIPLLYVLEAVSTVRYGYLIIFRSEVERSTGSEAGGAAIFHSYGLDYQPDWFKIETLWPVFLCYMVLMRFVVLVTYRIVVAPTKCKSS